MHLTNHIPLGIFEESPWAILKELLRRLFEGIPLGMLKDVPSGSIMASLSGMIEESRFLGP